MTTIANNPYSETEELPTPEQDGPWRDQALCTQTDPDVFHPETADGIEAAKRICRRCDVRTQCLETALTDKEQHGVWGGLSTPERNKLRKKRLRSGEILSHSSWVTLRRAERDASIIALAQKVDNVRLISRQLDINERTVHRVLIKNRAEAQTRGVIQS